MKEWFMSREPRERLVLGIGAAAVLVVVLWGLIWSPLNRHLAELHVSVTHASSLLVNLERAAAAAPISKSAAEEPVGSMVVLVDRTSRGHGLAGAFTHTRPDGTNGINVTFQDASFDALLGWLMALRTSYGVDVESASFYGSKTRGVVSGQVLLRKS